MFDDLNINKISGLTSAQAAANLQRDGYNQLPTEKRRSPLRIAFSILREPMFILLVAGSVIYALLGDVEEALMLLSFVIIIMGITFYQEHKTERALEKLRELSSPRALVIRDNQEKRIAGRDVVRDDIILISEGDRVPADATILACNNLLIDESLLTGESVAVQKFAESTNEQISNLFSGTLVVQGYGIAKVSTIGAETELGKIGSALQRISPEKSLLQKETGKLVKNLALFGLILCLIVAIIYAITRADLINGFLAGISLAMAILPEEFPVILTVFLAIGAWRMSKEHVLTRKVPTIETLGSATVLCVDKTGTITQNSMSVEKIFANDNFYSINSNKEKSLPENFHQLIEYCILAGKKNPFDPMEKAIKTLGEKYLADTEHLHKDWQLIREYPLSKELLALSHVWRSPDKNFYEIAAKGAPEAIADLCHLTTEQIEKLEEKITIMANQGLRVLGVAKAKFQQTDLPTDQHKFNFEFLGLVGLADPIRETVPPAIKRCYAAGIKIIMITGDYAGTALNIAKQIGLKNHEAVITGNELSAMSDTELKQRIKQTNIFARIVPEQKLRIINALKANNEIVAMTGDGVNDAPALKAAHIGIAMGERGTDVARESSSLVLLDDDFSSIVEAVAMGRRIFTNIKKAITYTFAIHIPIIGITLFPVLFKFPLILLPAHIVFLEMIIDPTCSIVFEAEPEEKNSMQKPPRNIKEKLFNKKILINSLTQGIVVLTACIGVYLFSKHLGFGPKALRTVTYSSLILANLALIISNRSATKSLIGILMTPNRALWWVIASTLVVLASILYIPWLNHLFNFAKINFMEILIALAAGVFSMLLLETAKIVRLIKD